MYLAYFWGRRGGKGEECHSASRIRIYGDALKKARGIILSISFKYTIKERQGIYMCLLLLGNAVAVNLNRRCSSYRGEYFQREELRWF